MRPVDKKHVVRAWGAGMAIAMLAAGSATTGSCVFETRTNLCEQWHLRCKEGQECATDEPKCIEIGGCGNHRPDPGEACDDGNNLDGDGCSADCKSDESCGNEIVDEHAKIPEQCDHGKRNGQPDDNCDPHCQFKTLTCGDRVVDPGEDCDPGEMDSTGCNSNQANNPDNLFNPDLKVGCKFSRCGDGYVNTAINPITMHPMEACDSGGMITMLCNGPLCTTPVCGDNFHNAEAGEDCDNGNNDSAGCNGSHAGMASCRFPACGDGHVNTAFKPQGSTQFEFCDTSGDSDTCNGDGNGSSSNDDDARCQTPSCGDGYVNTKFTPPDADAPENCDNKDGADTLECNGNNSGSNGPGSCRTPSCGDGYVNRKSKPAGSMLFEDCDTKGDSSTCNGDGNGDSSNNANAKCRPPSCGDGYKNAAFTPPGDRAKPEQCDTRVDSQSCNGNNNDNNNDKGLGDCQMPTCGDGYVNGAFTPPGSTLTEQCDNVGGMDTPGCNGNNGGHNGPGSCRFSTCKDGYKNAAAGEQCDPGDPPHGIPAIPCPVTTSCQPDCTCR